MKSILLKFENEKDYFMLANMKTRWELVIRESLTWEEFIIRLKIAAERGIKFK